KGRRQRGRTSLQISPQCSHRRNRRTRYATGGDGKGGSISREGQAIVQTRGLLKSQRLDCACYCVIAPLLPASHHGVRQLLRQRRMRSSAPWSGGDLISCALIGGWE